ncbi:GNAT family N-acetyltransferase [Peribacillus sp. NPDC097675]|uniref:GNAT family N-acetyltransferase n=1 Tax=Peribacillus sp. NPDC097675 TaxID=3390618 RepID=UPI003D05A221
MMMKIITELNSLHGHQLFSLQKKAYAVEAEMIGYFEIPPLLETFDQFTSCKETFIGFFIDGEIAGAISYKNESGQIEICRMIVHPDHFRKGIANALLTHLQSIVLGEKLTVSTGALNHPARKLYEKNGFLHTKDVEVAPEFFISLYEK